MRHAAVPFRTTAAAMFLSVSVSAARLQQDASVDVTTKSRN